MSPKGPILLLLTLLGAGAAVAQQPPILRPGDQDRFMITGFPTSIAGFLREVDERSLLLLVEHGPWDLCGDTLRVLLDQVRDLEIKMLGAGEAFTARDRGKQIQVRGGGHFFEGRMQYADYGLLQIGDRAPLDIAAVDSVWIAESATVKGAVIGGIALGIPSLAFIALVCSEDPYAGCSAGSVLLGTSVMALAGAVVGAVIGELNPKWRLRYPGYRPVQRNRVALRLVPLPEKTLGVGVGIPFRLR